MKENEHKHMNILQLSDEKGEVYIVKIILNMKFNSTNNKKKRESRANNNENVEILISNGEKVWITKENIKVLAKSNPLKIDHYSTIIMEALKGEKDQYLNENNIAFNKYTYKIQHCEEEKHINLVVYLNVLENTNMRTSITAAEFKCNLYNNPKIAMINFIRGLIDDHEQMQEKNKTLSVIAETVEEATSLAQTTIKEKNEMESLMYSQFTKLLNSKKRKIRELEDKIVDLTKEHHKFEKIMKERSSLKESPLINTQTILESPPNLNAKKKIHETPSRDRIMRQLYSTDDDTPTSNTSDIQHPFDTRKTRITVKTNKKYYSTPIKRNASSVDAEDLLNDMLDTTFD
mmetsp:Transcript_7985/g.11866  ORF Transcript_7985/g.11866 Transcript_7985/m.11866 type:complete len:346 (-) Transcript_7985:2372-3409(-)